MATKRRSPLKEKVISQGQCHYRISKIVQDGVEQIGLILNLSEYEMVGAKPKKVRAKKGAFKGGVPVIDRPTTDREMEDEPYL